MEALFTIVKYLFFGFIGLIALLVIVVVIFGKRIHKRWEYEADFLDSNGREFGEFEIELSRIEKEEPDDTLKVKLRMRHPSLVNQVDSVSAGQLCRVVIGGTEVASAEFHPD